MSTGLLGPSRAFATTWGLFNRSQWLTIDSGKRPRVRAVDSSRVESQSSIHRHVLQIAPFRLSMLSDRDLMRLLHAEAKLMNEKNET